MPATIRAVSDERAGKLWDQLMKLAEEGCLIVNAYGGVATLAVPREQRSAGCRDQVLQAHVRLETLEPEE